MRDEILTILQSLGPLTIEQLSDALMWEQALVSIVVNALVKAGDIHAEIDGTHWLATSQEQSSRGAA